ncbi:MAG: NnrU family protein, partial [Aestuariivirgaceae bacterium]
MTVFIVGLVLFFGVHIVPMTPLKPALQRGLGENPYKGLFSVISLIGLGVTIWGFSMLRSGPGAFPIYWPPEWLRPVSTVLIFAGFICLGAFHGKGYLKLWLRHPMSIGIALWSLGHLLSNGRQTAVVFFACFLAYAVLDIVVGLAKGKVPTHEPRIRSDIIAVVVGTAAFLFFAWLHQYMVGIPLF